MDELNGILRLGGGGTGRGTRNLVEDSLDDDDANVDPAGQVWKELGDKVADRIEGVTSEDANGGRAGIALDARDVEVRELCVDGVGQEGSVVGHVVAVVTLRDDGTGD